MSDDKKINSITEVPKTEQETKSSNVTPEYDFVVSEAAVGSYGGVRFTVAGFEESEDPASEWETYLDIEKSRFVDVMNGTIFDLNESIKLLVVKLEKENDDQKGKIFFKVLE